jgi:hypothetical protein
MTMEGWFAHPSLAPATRVRDGAVRRLENPVTSDGIQTFRAVYHAAVDVDARCDAIRLSAASALSVHFETITLSLTKTNASWVESWQDASTHSTVRLKYPGAITAFGSGAFSRVAIHRLDRDAVAEEPTLETDSGATLGDAFVGPDFRAELSQPKAVANSPQLSLSVRGRPTSPRLRVLHGATQEILWQWLDPGEHAASAFEASGSALRDALESALVRALDITRGLTQSPDGSAPATVRVLLQLVVESDAPCGIVFEHATLQYELEAELLPRPAPLAFDGHTRRSLHVSLPDKPATPIALALRASGAPRAERHQPEPPALAASSGSDGIALTPGTSLAAAWQPDRPYWLLGFAVGWYAFAEDTRLAIGLYPDAAGQPAARAIARGEVELSASGASWAQCRWPLAAVQPGAYWLQVAPMRGSGLWLGEPSAAERIARTATPQRIEQRSVPLALRRLPLEPLEPLEVALQPTALLFSLNGIPLPTSTAAGDERLFEGTLEALPNPLRNAASWTLEAVCSSAFDLSVRSVRVRYLS